jgi:hypothetical protein
MHLHLPYLPIEIRKELGFQEYAAHDMLKCDTAWVATSRSCCLFCCCSSMMCCQSCCPGMFMETTHDKDAGFLMSTVLSKDIRRSSTGSIHGLVYNALVPMISLNWGFDPRDSDVSQTKASPPFLASSP